MRFVLSQINYIFLPYLLNAKPQKKALINSSANFFLKFISLILLISKIVHLILLKTIRHPMTNFSSAKIE